MSLKCPSCEREIQKNWRFCRFCGTRLDLAQNEEFETTPPSSIHGNDAILEESPVASAEKEPVQPEPHKIDRETYKRIILTRDKRRRLALEKKELQDLYIARLKFTSPLVPQWQPINSFLRLP